MIRFFYYLDLCRVGGGWGVFCCKLKDHIAVCDDTTLYCNLSNNTNQNYLNSELNMIREWLASNKLSVKFLGINIDNKLKWHEHIIYIKNKVSKAISIIYKARKYANKQTVKQMYYTFVFPYLIYCCEIWGNTSHTYLDSLIKYQKKIIRIMTFSQYDAHSKPLFMKLHILDLQKLIIHRIALMMYKHSVQLLPVPVSNLFIKNSSIHVYNTRSCNMYIQK